MKEISVLHTSRCTLTAVTHDDIPALREILDDVDTQRFLPELCREFQTAESLQQFIKSFDHYLYQNEGFLWGTRKNENLIGFIAIMDIPDKPTLFYATHPAYRNCGYMKESLSKIMGYVFEKGLCRSLQTEVYLKNAISQIILKSLSFHMYKKDNIKEYYIYKLINQ